MDMSETPWNDLNPRERDALLAEQVFGYRLDYEFAETFGAPTVPALRDQHDEWGLLPNYTTDHNDSRLLEDEIERRGTAIQDDYIRALLAVVAPDGSSVGCFWKVIRATPDQRAQAFVATLRGEQHAAMGTE